MSMLIVSTIGGSNWWQHRRRTSWTTDAQSDAETEEIEYGTAAKTHRIQISTKSVQFNKKKMNDRFPFQMNDRFQIH